MTRATTMELDTALHERITRHCADGDAHAGVGRFREALHEYHHAWKLVPEPKKHWNASTWILGAIGDAAFLGGWARSAQDALEYAMHCPDAIGNPFLHLRLGQVLFDAGEHDRAADELMRAYLGAGGEIFATEDGRYLDFLRTRAEL